MAGGPRKTKTMAGGQVAAHRAFVLCNYLLLGASSGCIFVTLSLHLVPSPCGLLLVFLHALTAVFAAAGLLHYPAAGTGAQHTAHTAGAVLTAIFQGAAAVLAFTRTADFLTELRSYVREDDGAVILRLVGGLGAAIFVLEWASLALNFALRLSKDGGEEATDGGEYSKSLPSGYHV